MSYADDLGLAAETLKLLAERFCPWKNNLSSHGLRRCTSIKGKLTVDPNFKFRWICSSRLADRVPSEQLRCRLRVNSIQEILRYNRLRWYGHVQRMDPQNWPRKVMTMPVEGQNPRGRPKKRWSDSIREEIKTLKLQKANPLDRGSWRAAIRPKGQPTTSNPCMTGNNGRKAVQ
ncbi:hypothetical protein Bbelb_048140 [Branchiostoma belcheri]|nr:hypothetical protein Bbelb_048140 [Branchiostoma belcheri]